MKTVYLAMAMTVTVLSLASCTVDDNIQEDEQLSGPFEISIIGEMGEFGSILKSDVESSIRMKWNTTTNDTQKDIVWVYGYDGTSFKSMSEEGLRATASSSNPYIAAITGTIDLIPSDGYLYLVHCPAGTYSEPDVSDGSAVFDMSAVEQGADMMPSFIIYSVVKVSRSELKGLNAMFSFATSVVVFNITGFEAGDDLTKAVVSGINKTCSLNFDDGQITVSAAAETPSESDLGTFTKILNETATATGKAAFFLGVPALSANSGRQLAVTTDGKTYTDCGLFPLAYPANSYINTISTVSK